MSENLLLKSEVHLPSFPWITNIIYTYIFSFFLINNFKWHKTLTCILREIPSLSESSSARFLVPSTFLRVVWASRRVELGALDTLTTADIGQYMRKKTTASTDTVTESLVRICKPIMRHKQICECRSCLWFALKHNLRPEVVLFLK